MGMIALMSTLTIQELLRDPAALIKRVEAGESIVVTRDAVAVAEIKPCQNPPLPRRIGLADGAFEIPDDFDAPLPDDILKSIYGP
jgi:antitoxin (DNA-binding transcriptional repressor) of toxin-antitoxin stability system